MAVAGVDTTFADRGGLTLPGDYEVRNVLATNGTLFVDAYSPAVNGRYLLNYAASGELRLHWGRRGRVSLPVLADPKSDDSLMVLDTHSYGVYVGDLPKNRSADSVAVQRVTNDGQIDKAFGRDGVFTFAEKGNLQAIVPLKGYRALLAVDRFASDPTVDPNGDDTRYTTQLDLVGVNAYGQRDANFGRRGVATVSGGAFSSTYGDFGGGETAEHSDFADLQFRSDGGYRVLSLRNNHTYRRSFLGGNGGTVEPGSTDRVSLDSQVFDARGQRVSGLTENYGVVNTKIAKSIAFSDAGFYKPILAKADGDGAVVVGGTATRKLVNNVFIGKNYEAAPNYRNITVLRVSPGRRVLEAPQLVGDGVASFARSGDGDLIVRTSKVFQRFDGKFNLDANWGTRGTVAVDRVTNPLTIDDEGRLLATRYEHLIRIDG